MERTQEREDEERKRQEAEVAEVECLSGVLGPILDANGNCKCCGQPYA